MNERRKFLSLSAGSLLPVSAGLASAGAVNAADGDDKEFVGAWTTIHTLPLPPNWFREFLTFHSGGTVVETNSFINMTTPQNFEPFGLPKATTGSDGMGNWERIAKGKASVVFRKLLFAAGEYYLGDLVATGTMQSDGENIYGDWVIQVVDVKGNLIVPLGAATSTGTRIK